MTDNAEPKRVLLADDHFLFRMGVKAILHSSCEFAVVSEAENGQEAVDLFREHRPDIALIDLRMPRMGGIEATQMITNCFKNSRVIILTTYDGDQEIRNALKAGAKGYLLKQARAPEILGAIRAVLAGGTCISPTLLRKARSGALEREITPRQLEILRLLAAGLGNQEIGVALGLTLNTVKTHLKILFAKLGVSDRTEAVCSAVKRGMITLDL